MYGPGVQWHVTVVLQSYITIYVPPITYLSPPTLFTPLPFPRPPPTLLPTPPSRSPLPLSLPLSCPLPLPASPPTPPTLCPQALDCAGITGSADSRHGGVSDQLALCKDPLSAVVSCGSFIVLPTYVRTYVHMCACWRDNSCWAIGGSVQHSSSPARVCRLYQCTCLVLCGGG